MAVAMNHRRTLVLIWLLAGILLGLTWWHVAVQVADNRIKEIAATERDLANLTRVGQEHATRTLRAADQVIRFIRARYLEIGHRLDLAALTRDGVIDAEIFHQVGIIDAKGIYALANRPVTGQLDLSDREHFQVHLTTDSDDLFVSRPVLGRATGKWSIQLTRRIDKADGSFGGVVVVSMDPGYFTNFYKELKLGRQGVMALYGLDGIARARKVGQREEFGTAAQAATMFDWVARGMLEGSFTQRSVVDDVERLYHFRKIPGYPLLVVDGLDTEELLSAHLLAKDALIGQASMASLLIVALAAVLTRHLMRLRQEIVLHEQSRQQLEDRNAQLNAIFDLSPDGFVSFDQQHRVKYISPAFSLLMGQGSDRLEGLDEHDFSAWMAQRCTAAKPFVGVGALRLLAKSGKTDQRELIELNARGKRIMQVGLRTSEASTVSQILYLRDMTHELEVDQMKSEFLATAAHELRTPMASIYGFAELLLNEEFDPVTRHEFLSTIYTQSRLIAGILDELLDLARIEAGRDRDFRYGRVELQALLQDLCKSWQRPAGRAEPVLDLPAAPLHLMADATKLRQALLNVLSNAYKYSPGGGPVVVKAWLLEGLRDERQGILTARVCVEVSDQGIGMTAAQLERVGERFYRADSSGKIPGTGLGMSIVKEIVGLHNGNLAIESTPGQGTRVRMCLPAYASQHAEHPPGRDEHEKIGKVSNANGAVNG